MVNIITKNGRVGILLKRWFLCVLAPLLIWKIFPLRLAHRFQGSLLDDTASGTSIRRLILVTDGIDIDDLMSRMTNVEADEVIVIGIGTHLEHLSTAFHHCRLILVEDGPPSALWLDLEGIVKSPETPISTQRQPPNVFVSHAITDEERIYGPLNIMRARYGYSLFVCADSIDVGNKWRDQIVLNLKQCDVFLLLVSEDASKSTYCAFEYGVAYAMNKPMCVVNIDGSHLPAYLSDYQVIDVPRLLTRKPWLLKEDAILEEILTAIKQSREQFNH